ncbi:MAG: CRISPR-associated endonuclease Cas3'' [Verrucomicrobia bacterium]|nr:MAG: CRISPR-associated endonuclease Cas3'' [Verrucomicrobiota bacterium]
MMLYAHSRRGEPPENWQPLEKHLRTVAEKAAAFAEQFSSADWAWNAGWLHDLGKATKAFQQYLKTSNGLDDPDYDADGSVSNHASTGAALAFDQLGMPGKALAYLLAGHHAGLPDYQANETGNAALLARLPEGRQNLATLAGYVEEVKNRLRSLARPPVFVNQHNFHFWMRMLFSCLLDADRLDSEAVEDTTKAALRASFPTLGKLAPLLFQALEKMEREAPKTNVNAIRAEIRRACEAAADKVPGLFSLTVPTGGGKTLSAMAFALRHALKHGKRRIIYVIPYTSIIEQTAKTLGEIFGPENIVEHHSNLDPTDPRRNSLRAELAAENWDAPVVVTTNVQFFESLYAAKTGRCRKLHNIVNSVIILDEAQLLPPELLTPCVDALNQLVQCFGVTLVLATATQPALPGLVQPHEIIPSERQLYERLKRTEIILPKNMTARTEWRDLATRLQQHEQVLCVVNTRRNCHDLFKLMPPGTLHLSALMCGAHRSEVITEIKRRLAVDEPCRVISTQLVEAGVDIDFPVVYRALGGLDSIAQAAGRCNREGKLNSVGKLGQVHVFVPPKPAPPGLLRKGEDTTRELPSLDGFDPQKPEFFARYFSLFYQRVNSTKGRPGSKIVFNDDLFRDFPAIPFRTAGNEFAFIDEAGHQGVFASWSDNEKWLAQLRTIGPTRENLRALQRSCVNLSKGTFLAAQASGNVEEIWPGFWLWIGKYDGISGLDAFGEGFSPEEMCSV